MGRELESFLDEKVRPLLALHGGGLRVLSVEEGTLRFTLTGQCFGCPSAWLTAENLVAKMCREEFPAIQQAIFVNTTSEDLLKEVGKILRHR